MLPESAAKFDWPQDPHAAFELLRKAGFDAVLLESGGSGWTFVCVVNKDVKVPPGEEGLHFIRDFLKKHCHPELISCLPAGTAGSSRFRIKSGMTVSQVQDDGAPPFTRGFVGFVSYDLGAKWNGVIASSAKRSRCPLAHFVYVDQVFAFQNHRSPVIPDLIGDLSDSRLRGNDIIRGNDMPQSNLTKKQYLQKIRTIKKHLYAGNTYQVNFSQRFTAPYSEDAFELYKKVTAINPSPFQFFMETEDFAVISNSPERLFKITCHPEFISGSRSRNEFGMTLETRPIKGTMPRGKTPEEDERSEKILLASSKENAELTMIVDLERNDVGKLCIPGSVEVTEHRTVERYSHVMHTVSNVRGKMRADFDWYDALHALHPSGSITGCPKKRTVEIIRELEKESRGVYCGTAGYIDISGQCDFNIMIRTFWLDKKADGGTLTFRSGGGIVVDSDPEKEYEETLHKVGAIIASLE